MYAVSEEFLQAIRFSSRRVTVADVYYGTELEPIMTNIPVSAGTISIDRTGDIRRSGSVTLAADDLNVNDFLPVGIEIRVKSGFHFYSGFTELVPLGVFRTEDVSFNEGSNNTINISFFDRGKAHQDITQLIQTNLAGLSMAQVLDQFNDYTFLNTGLVPEIIVDPSFDQSLKFPGGTMAQGNNLEIIKKVAEQWGGEQYFDRNGDHVFGQIPAVTAEVELTDTVWDIDVGETGVLVSAGRRTTRDGTFNAVGVYGATVDSATGDRAFAQAIDSYSLSPTYYDGKFGRKTLVISNDLLTTAEACSVVAYEQLKNHQGLAKSINFTSLWNPALDAGDLVLFTFLDGSQEIHLIDSLSFNLASGEMQGNTRSIQYIF